MSNKLPTAEQLYETAFYDKSYDSQHGFINMKQRVVHIVESHTQAHTKELREQVKELESQLSRYRSALKKIANSYSNSPHTQKMELIAKEALKEEQK